MEAKYDRIGIQYNQTRAADPYLTERLFEHLHPAQDGLYLDIGCGTGNYTHALHQKGLPFIGIDPSETMLEKARVKNPAIDWRAGVAEAIPLPDQQVNGITAFLTTHHWSDLDKGFAELNRVLKNGGRLVIFTATRPQMQGYWLHHYFPIMLKDSIQQMPAYEQVESALNQNGFKILQTEKYFIRPDLKDLFLYNGKHKPRRYFDPAIRQSISTFSDLANQAEIREGLSKLKADIETGKIQEVIQSYENTLGDYLFIISQRPDH